ncbi:hypothetical protein DRP77_08585 [Candidatus Poribacteria bacterium]|nr:MAG: hypothetical protein DRP77_08585 [Candidatus Poribacteria bacterium]
MYIRSSRAEVEAMGGDMEDYRRAYERWVAQRRVEVKGWRENLIQVSGDLEFTRKRFLDLLEVTGKREIVDQIVKLRGEMAQLRSEAAMFPSDIDEAMERLRVKEAALLAELAEGTGMSRREAEKLVEVVRGMARATEEAAPAVKKGTGEVALSAEEVKAILQAVKAEVDDYIRKQRAAAMEAGRAWKANAEEIFKVARTAVKAKLAEKGITDESIIYQKREYGELADFLLKLWEDYIKQRQQQIEEGLKAELEAIDRQVEAGEMAYQMAIERLNGLLEAHRDNAELRKLITDKINLYERRMEAETLGIRVRRFDEYLAYIAKREEETQRYLKGIKVGANEEYARAVMDAYDELRRFGEEAQRAMTRQEIEGIRERVREYYDRNKAIIETNEGLKASYERLLKLLDQEYWDLAEIEMAVRRIELAERDRVRIAEGAAEAKRREAELADRLKEFLEGLRDEEEKLRRERNRWLWEMRTPWGIVRALPELQRRIREAERYTDEWMDAVQGLEDAYRSLFDMVSEGVDVLGLEMDQLSQDIFVLTEALMIGDPFTAAVYGARALMDALQEVGDQADEAKEKLEELRREPERIPEELERIDEQLARERAEVKRLKEERDRLAFSTRLSWEERQREIGVIDELIERHERRIAQLEAERRRYERIPEELVGERFAEDLAQRIQDIWRQAFDPENVRDPVEAFTNEVNEMILDRFLEAFTAQSAVLPVAEQYGKLLTKFLADGMIDQWEAAELDRWRRRLMQAFQLSTQQLEEAKRFLPFDEIAQEAGRELVEGVREGAEKEIEAFQTISNITRFQANQIISQLSLHSTYLRQIASNTRQIADNTSVLPRERREITVIKQGLDEHELANRQAVLEQAQGIGVV